LQTLDLQVNNLSGEITKLVDGLSQCSNSSLEYLDLSGNGFLGGNLPSSLGGLNKLQTLDLYQNSWKGVLTEVHFQNLTRLKCLWLSAEFSANWTLALDVKHDWVPPFKMAAIFF